MKFNCWNISLLNLMNNLDCNTLDSYLLIISLTATGAGGAGDGRAHEAEPAAAGRRGGHRRRQFRLVDAAGHPGAAPAHPHGRGQGAAAAAKSAGEQAQVTPSGTFGSPVTTWCSAVMDQFGAKE